MINFDSSDIREILKKLSPTPDFDSSFTFHYDETNNHRKFYVRENNVKEIDFNVSFNSNFILGGLVYEGSKPDIRPLFSSLNLQNNIRDVKFKHIAKGDNFFSCLKSIKLNCFLKYFLENNLYVHYSSVNILYWSIVDIVDSAIASAKEELQLDLSLANYLKNDLYKLAKLEIESITELFYNSGYPNIKKELVREFIEALISIFDGYIDTEEFHFGLTYLKQILKLSKRKDSLPFVMDEKDHVLIENFSQFYLRPVYTFKNSTHIFDNEISISEIFDGYKITDKNQEVKNYSFVDSQDELFIQASDIFVGLIGKFNNYINASSREKMINDFDTLTEMQLSNLEFMFDLIDRSDNKNTAFFCQVDSHEELSKMKFLNEISNSKKASRRKPKKIEDQSQCSVCKITNAEIDEISDLDIHKVVIKLTSSGMCLNHLIGYLELRKFGGLMGKELLKSLKDCN